MITREYFKDKLVLFLNFVNLLLALATIVVILIRIDFNQTKFILRYLPLDSTTQFETADPSYIYTFIVATVLALVAGWIMSYKIYDLFKAGAYFSLVLMGIVLLANLIISEALLRI